MNFENWWANQTANFDPSEIGLMQLARVTWNAAQDVEREMCQDLFEQCRQLLRYDGIDKDRVRQAVDHIRDIVNEMLVQLENDSLE